MDFKCHAGDLLCDNHHGPKDRVNIKKKPKQTKKQTRSTFKSQCSDFRIHTFPHALNLCPEFSCLAAIPYSFRNYCLIFYVESSNNSANTVVVSSQWLVSSRITAAFIKLPVVVFFSSSVLVSPPYPDLMIFSISAGYV